MDKSGGCQRVQPHNHDVSRILISAYPNGDYGHFQGIGVVSFFILRLHCFSTKIVAPSISRARAQGLLQMSERNTLFEAEQHGGCTGHRVCFMSSPKRKAMLGVLGMRGSGTGCMGGRG